MGPPQTSVTDAIWCGCGREAFIHLSGSVVCPFCFLARMVEAGFLSRERACCMEAVLQARRAEESLRLTSIVLGGGEERR